MFRDYFKEAVAKHLNERFKFSTPFFEHYNGNFIVDEHMGMDYNLFPPECSKNRWTARNLYLDEWDKALEPYGIQTEMSGGNYSNFYFVKELHNFDTRAYTKILRIWSIDFKSKNDKAKIHATMNYKFKGESYGQKSIWRTKNKEKLFKLIGHKRFGNVKVKSSDEFS